MCKLVDKSNKKQSFSCFRDNIIKNTLMYCNLLTNCAHKLENVKTGMEDIKASIWDFKYV